MFHVNMSIRQLLRTPVKTLLFVLLLAAVTIMLVFGSVLYLQTQAHIEAVEDAIGKNDLTDMTDIMMDLIKERKE